jgi:hypothetical protein
MWIKRLVVMVALLPLFATGALGFDTPGKNGARVWPADGRTPRPQEHAVARQVPGRNALVVRAGRLHGEAQNMPLASVLQAIARQSGVQIVTDERVANKPVSIQFKEAPLDQGLLQLLRDCDIFFFYGVKGEGSQASPALQGVWIYPQGDGESLAPVLPAPWTSAPELEPGRNDAEEAERARAVEATVEQPGTQVLDAVLTALEDPEDQVRERALHAALYAGIPLPLPRLEELVQYDPSPLVRFLALGAMAGEAGEVAPETPHHRILVEHARRDPSPEVREQARQILQQWDNPVVTLEEESQGEAETTESESK